MSIFLEARPEGKAPVRLELKAGLKAVVGRAEDVDMKVEGEPFMSRRHVEVRFEGGRVKVRRLPDASNPVIYQGHDSNEYQGDEFAMGQGDFFVIGKTRFVLVEEREERAASAEEQAPDKRRTVGEEELYGWGGRSDRLRLLDLLQIPEMLRTMKREQFYAHLAGLLRMSTGGAWACIARPDGQVVAKDAGMDAPLSACASKSLIQAAIKDAPKPTWYSWSQPAGDIKATMQEGADWAICAAMSVPGEEPLILYVMGKGGGTGDTGHADMENCRFVGLVADMVGRSLSVSRLETWHNRLQHYFSGQIITKILSSSDPKEIEPRLAESTVLFFDIRGFSKVTEGRNEKILAHLNELKAILTAMTDEIFKENGVVLQYQGDGILACWNVPVAEPNHVDRACRAALNMVSRLTGMPGGWRCGVGLHTGEVVAGAIGSEQVFSYSVMGTVVNQASRVEGITKAVETPILVTREVAEKASREVAIPMRVGRFQPAGMTVALDLFDLSPPPADAERIATFTKGLEAFERGEWESAFELLGPIGLKHRPARYLMSLAENFRRRPPREWRGIIELSEK